MKAIWQSLAVAAAVGVAACPVDPQIDPTGKSCGQGDPCPVGFDCYDLLCTPSCNGDAGCDPNLALPANVLAASPCHCDTDCPCPQVCVVDPYWVGQGIPTVCEYSCLDGMGTALDCIDPGTVCNQVSCVANTCTDLYERCNAAATNDGTCLPLLTGGAGECLQSAPNSDGNCSTLATRADPNALCKTLQFCEPNVGNDGGTCADVCIPSSEFAQCPNDPGDACIAAVDGVSVCEPPE